MSALSDDPMVIDVAAGETVIKEKDAGETMYVVKRGTVDIRFQDVRLERVTAGGIVGEMALIDEAERSATVVAHTDTVLIPITRSRFRYLIRNEPDFAFIVMNTMIRRIRQMNTRLQISKKTRSRVAKKPSKR
jgi:CRP/FNR family transcriptional regulator, cyclic AMP receptor protein